MTLKVLLYLSSPQCRAMLVPFSAGIVLALCSLRCEAQTPEITSFSAISTQQTQTIAITGSGFGTQGPYAGNSLYIEFFDFTAGWAAGYSGPCYNGHVYYGGTCSDAVNLVVQSWTDSKIVLGGFSGAWGSNGWTLANGDQAQISVWNAQSGSGPASVTITVGAAPVAPVLTSPANGATGVVSPPTLTWNAVSGAASYNVYFGVSPTPPFATNTTLTNFSPGLLVPGSTYYWQVAAVNSDGATASAVWSFTTSAGAQTLEPTGVSPAAGGRINADIHVIFYRLGGRCEFLRLGHSGQQLSGRDRRVLLCAGAGKFGVGVFISGGRRWRRRLRQRDADVPAIERQFDQQPVHTQWGRQFDLGQRQHVNADIVDHVQGRVCRQQDLLHGGAQQHSELRLAGARHLECSRDCADGSRGGGSVSRKKHIAGSDLHLHVHRYQRLHGFERVGYFDQQFPGWNHGVLRGVRADRCDDWLLVSGGRWRRRRVCRWIAKVALSGRNTAEQPVLHQPG
jgi:hypothetical protein